MKYKFFAPSGYGTQASKSDLIPLDHGIQAKNTHIQIDSFPFSNVILFFLKLQAVKKNVCPFCTPAGAISVIKKVYL